MKSKKWHLRRRLELLRIAAGKFRECGFERTRLVDVADRAEMTKANLYHYFKSKDEILYFCQDYSCRRMLQAGSQISRLRLRADTKLYLLCVAHVRCILDELYGASAHIEFTSLPRKQLGEIIRMRDAHEKLIRKVVESGIRENVFRKINSKLITFAILGALNWAARWYKPEDEFTAEQISLEFADFLVTGLLKTGVKLRYPPDMKVIDHENKSAIQS